METAARRANEGGEQEGEEKLRSSVHRRWMS
jgi:hypothetical protein